MTILIIDTAFETCQVALAQDGKIIAQKRAVSGGQHDRVLATMLQDLCAEIKVTPDLFEKIIVTTGPGRFTGLRVGIAFARGLALVKNTPVVGVATTDAIARDMDIAYPTESEKIIVVAVKRGESFVFTTSPTPSSIVSVFDDAIAAHMSRYENPLAGGILSPAVAQIFQEKGVRIAADVTEPSLTSILAIGAALKPGGAVRPYYAA